MFSVISLLEKAKVNIDVENPGLLEVPKDKDIRELPLEHFKKLIDAKGWEAVSKGLVNLKIWNKKKNPSLSRWASSTQKKLSDWVERQREEGNVE